jgi:hypothetical protein
MCSNLPRILEALLGSVGASDGRLPAARDVIGTLMPASERDQGRIQVQEAVTAILNRFRESLHSSYPNSLLLS